MQGEKQPNAPATNNAQSSQNIASSPVQSKILKTEQAFTGKWLGMKYVTYSVGEKVNHNYESVYRTTKKQNCITDGVQVIPIIKYSKQSNRRPKVVLIANYRPPVGAFCLEFPSGLVDDDKYEQNMKRELLEQTGYVLNKTVEFPTPTLYIDPWKSNESTMLFIGLIDGDDPNHRQKQSLEATQNIRVFQFELDDTFPRRLKEFADAGNYLIEGKLWSICAGLLLASVLLN